MSIQNEIQDLIQADVISVETADKIRQYYDKQKQDSSNRLYTVFGILGAILVGLGIILILAHNWDNLSRTTKTIIALLPLLLSQLLCIYTLIQRPKSPTWKESSSVLLFFSIAASIALVSQIYNIPGDLSSFVFTWMLLSLPIIYLMPSSIVSLFYIIGITYYGVETGYWTNPAETPLWYALLLLLVLPYYYYLYKTAPLSNAMNFHNWLIPVSILIMLGTIAAFTRGDFNSIFIIIAYSSLLGLYYLIGDLSYFSNRKLRLNSFKVIGSLGTVILLLIFSFGGIWKEIRTEEFVLSEVIVSPEFISAVMLTLMALGMFFNRKESMGMDKMKPLAPVFFIFLLIFIIGLFSGISVLLINLLLLVVGVLTIREGANQNHLGILNYGLLIITALITCRFFDTNLSFVLRGALFVLIGMGFFMTNYWMLNKRKRNES